jgi:hypothetical protein
MNISVILNGAPGVKNLGGKKERRGATLRMTKIRLLMAS